MQQQKPNTINLNAVQYDKYVSSIGVKNIVIQEVSEKVNDKGYLTFRLKCVDQNNEVSFEEFDYSNYGQRKIKKFCEKTEMFTEKEMREFNHMMFVNREFQVEYFNTKNKYYEPTNPNSREYILTVGNNTYKKAEQK